jgi:hypothetical protein
MQIRILASKLRLENLGRNAQIGYSYSIHFGCHLQIDEDAVSDPDPAYHFDADLDPTFLPFTLTWIRILIRNTASQAVVRIRYLLESQESGHTVKRII